MKDTQTIPYATPATRPNYGKAFLRLFLTTVASGVIFAVVGGVSGCVIGTHAGDYYSTVFGNDGIDAPKVGSVLGTVQGGALGVVVGLVLSVVLTWREIRLAQASAPRGN
ncbi:hypothetical protein [Humisphaera borealis]|uniref:Uncharacterized protein n=1 Tax=Humisphaera borealis TaxID=2807512 RepID=A0A7M2WRT3_9BACT|nr:hypothetical protein [Humisphaera borealis]QOV88228.1 hypothetical protein IPV69_18490 [Humisphaera borealis]